mgnify:CR=1 FL=1
MKDYSQHGESTFISNYIKNKKLKIPNVFFEIGALDGITNSNSRMFFEQGWSGALVEPNPNSFAKLFQNTKNLKKVSKFHVAIAEKFDIKNFSIVTTKNFEGSSGLDEKGRYKVICVPLDFITKDFPNIGIMSIDAEGYDTVIVDYLINQSTVRPKILMVENMTKSDRTTFIKKQSDILKKEYEFIRQISVNGIWKLRTL